LMVRFRGHQPSAINHQPVSRLWFGSRTSSRQGGAAYGHRPGAIPGSRTNFQTSRAPACGGVSKTLPVGGSTRTACQSGSWQTSNAPALQAGPCGSVTRRLHQFHRRENEIQVSLISSAFMGATPIPATNVREVIRLPGCNPGVAKRAGSDDWSVTSTSHQLDP